MRIDGIIWVRNVVDKVAMGRTEVGRYLIVYFIHKTTGEALIVSAREMTKSEKKSYGKK